MIMSLCYCLPQNRSKLGMSASKPPCYGISSHRRIMNVIGFQIGGIGSGHVGWGWGGVGAHGVPTSLYLIMNERRVLVVF
jgi:hypothetical protein